MAKQKSVRNIATAPRNSRYHGFNNTKRAGSTAAQVDVIQTLVRRNEEARTKKS